MMIFLMLLFLLLAASDVYITSKVLPTSKDLNPVTDWLAKRMAPLWAALISIAIPTIAILGVTAHFSAQRVLCVLIGMRLALLMRQLFVHRNLLWPSA